MRKLWPFLWKYRLNLSAGFLLLLISSALGVLIPWLLKGAIEALKESPGAAHLLLPAGLMAAAALGRGLTRIYSRWLLLGTSRHVEYDLRNHLFRHLQSLSRTFYLRTPTGEIMSRATHDLNDVRMLLGPGLTNGLNTVVVFAFVVSAMALLSPRLTLYALILYPLWFVGMRGLFARLHMLSQKTQETLGAISTQVQENLSGMMVVKAFVQEEAEKHQFDQLNDRYLRINSIHARGRSYLFGLMSLMGGVGSLIVLWAGGLKVISGEMTLGAFVAFNSYLAMLLWPTTALGWILNLFQKGLTAWRRLEGILGEMPDVSDAGGSLASAPVRHLKGEIEIRDLNYAYDGAGPILKGVNLHVRPGEWVALVGPVGSGKSTLVRLLPRLVAVPKDHIFLDGIEIHQIPLRVLREEIGFIPQETFLFSRTISQNIAFGDEAPPFSAIREAADQAHFAREVERFPKGFDAILGERGITLSTGQRQRTTIARGIIGRHSILIMDDGLSSLDSRTAVGLLAELRRHGRGLTTLLISHNLTAMREMDRIIVLKEGRVEEEGTHDVLLAKGGLYAELFERQRLLAELEVL
jgi:ATP-binding cassette subfamily B protein